MTLKVYIAAPWAFKAQASTIKKQFEAQGFTVTSRWIDFHENKPADQTGLAYDKSVLVREAIHDVEDVSSSDVLVLFNTQKRGEETSGKAVETGIAIAKGIPIILVGEMSNIFHHLPCVHRVGDSDEAIKHLKELVKLSSWVRPNYYTDRDFGDESDGYGHGV